MEQHKFKELEVTESFELRLLDGVHKFEQREDEFNNEWHYDNDASITREAYIMYRDQWIDVRSA